MAKEQVGDNLEAETAPFSFSIPSGGEELRVAAHVFIPNLVEKVVQLLEQNEKYIILNNAHHMIDVGHGTDIHSSSLGKAG